MPLVKYTLLCIMKSVTLTTLEGIYKAIAYSSYDRLGWLARHSYKEDNCFPYHEAYATYPLTYKRADRCRLLLSFLYHEASASYLSISYIMRQAPLAYSSILYHEISASYSFILYHEVSASYSSFSYHGTSSSYSSVLCHVASASYWDNTTSFFVYVYIFYITHPLGVMLRCVRKS